MGSARLLEKDVASRETTLVWETRSNFGCTVRWVDISARVDRIVRLKKYIFRTKKTAPFLVFIGSRINTPDIGKSRRYCDAISWLRSLEFKTTNEKKLPGQRVFKHDLTQNSRTFNLIFRCWKWIAFSQFTIPQRKERRYQSKKFVHRGAERIRLVGGYSEVTTVAGRRPPIATAAPAPAPAPAPSSSSSVGAANATSRLLNPNL